MFEIILLFAIGIGIGRLFRKCSFPGKISRYMSVTVCVLIFVLGITVGENENVTNELKRVVPVSLILGVCGITGSILGAYFVGRLIKRK